MTDATDTAFAANSNDLISCQGLTKLEYFACAAMQGMLANDWRGYADREDECNNLARTAVNFAKALIEELNKKAPCSNTRL